MTTKDSPRRTDGNGIPKPVVKWRTDKGVARAWCETCIWSVRPADLSVARLHVKTYPDHFVHLEFATASIVYAETTDGKSWVEAVNAL